jgi:hypothetical protein
VPVPAVPLAWWVSVELPQAAERPMASGKRPSVETRERGIVWAP